MPDSNPAANPPIMSPRLHTVFVEVQVHTAKCDLCERHNKLTLYRCTECGQHVCSECWKKPSGDGIHVFNGGVAGGPDLSADHAVDDETAGDRDDESQGRTRTRRRARVISDEEDDDVPTLKPAVPNVRTNSHKSANRETQRNSRIQSQESVLGQQRTAQAYDGPERQAAPTRTVFVNGQQTTRQAPDQILPNGPHQQIRQAPRPAQNFNAQQQATQLAPRHIQPAVYRPRPGVDVDQQAAHNQLAFAKRPHTNDQAPRTAPASISQQHAQTAAHMARIAAHNQQAFYLNRQPSAYTNTEQMEAGNRQVFLHENTQLVVNGNQVVAQSQRWMDLSRLSSTDANHVVQILGARNRQEAYLARQQVNHPHPGPAQTSASHGNTSPRPAHPHPSPAPTSASHGNTSSLQAQPHPGPAESSASRGNTSFLPAQDPVSAQHTAPLASRQFPHRVTIQDLLNRPSEGVPVRERSPEILEAADLPLAYVGVDQVSGVRPYSEEDAEGVSQLLNAADQLNQARAANSGSRSSSKKIVAKNEAAGAESISPYGPALSLIPRSAADTGPGKARFDKHPARFDGLRSLSGTPDTVSDLAVKPRGHSVYGHASLQPGSGSVRADSSESHDSAPRGAPSARLPMSDHAATYVNEWNSGRAALSSSSRDSATNAPRTQLRSPLPALPPRSNTGIQDTVAVGTKEVEAAEFSSPALGSPLSVTESPVGVDVVMIDPDVEYLEQEEIRRYKEYAVNNNPWTKGMAKGAEKARARAPEPISGLHSNGRAEKHQRGEKNGDRKTRKEQKASDDFDVVGARGRNGKEVHSEQISDDGSDIEITSWKDSQGSKTTGKHRGTKAGSKAPESSKTLKKGVAQVKKPERKGQKGKTTGT